MKPLKILVFEYITGGGFNTYDLPDALAYEGALMLQALVNDLSEIDEVELLVMLDERLAGRVEIPVSKRFLISPDQDCLQEYPRLIPACDAVWPVAPESGGILQNLCAAVEQAGKTLLASTSAAVALAGNKWHTYNHLQQHKIDTVSTELLAKFNFTPGEWLVKPVDGVSCENSFLLPSREVYETITPTLEQERYIIQPHLQGQKTSLSCLFKHGQGWLICVNLQYFDVSKNQYRLTGIDVNFKSQTFKYRLLVDDLAKALPGLWGYVGIDLIEIGERILVLEINPRLTSSYAGLRAALGLNCARAVLDLLAGDPHLQHTTNQAAYISTKAEGKYAD